MLNKIIALLLIALLLCSFSSALADEHVHISRVVDNYANFWEHTNETHSLYYCRQMHCIECYRPAWLFMKYGIQNEPHTFEPVGHRAEQCSVCGYVRLLPVQSFTPISICKT